MKYTSIHKMTKHFAEGTSRSLKKTKFVFITFGYVSLLKGFDDTT